jgi:hypothetical protein
MRRTSPLLERERTYRFALHMSAFDPKRTQLVRPDIRLSGEHSDTQAQFL